MGKKKRGHPDVEEILQRPWCYYCERDFDDLKILINHQKAKHFKCERCGRRLNTAGGLSVHMTQVHKETLDAIENALPNRSNLDVEIFGMEGVPQDVINTHNQRVLSQFHQAEAERRAVTGNPAPGSGPGNGPKKPKFESPEEIKKRLAEHKARKAAEQAAGISSGDVTPIGAGVGNQSPAVAQTPNDIQAGSPPYQQVHSPYGGLPPNSGFPAYPQPYGQPPVVSGVAQPLFAQSQPGYGSPPPVQQYPGTQQFQPNPQFMPPASQAFPPPFQPGSAPPFGAASPPLPFQQGQYQPPRMHTPPQNVLLPQRPGSLPAAPGLPQRPSFGAPPVNAFQMQQMHQGQIPGAVRGASPMAALNAQQPSAVTNQNGNYGEGTRSAFHAMPPSGIQAGEAAHQTSETTTSLDDLVSSAAREADKSGSKAETPTIEKKTKKDKDKPVKLVYSDNETSPEEKMAKLPRYAFVPDHKPETVLGEAITAAVTGVAYGPDDVLDAQD